MPQATAGLVLTFYPESQWVRSGCLTSGVPGDYLTIR